MNSATILVVDDDPGILSTVAEVLDLEGYRVETATNGAEALEVVERAAPRLVLLDMRMPVLDGWGFARAYRLAETPPPHVSILVMTAALDAEASCHQIDGAAWLGKPFGLVHLLSKVEGLTQRAA